MTSSHAQHCIMQTDQPVGPAATDANGHHRKFHCGARAGMAGAAPTTVRCLGTAESEDKAFLGEDSRRRAPRVPNTALWADRQFKNVMIW